MSDSNLYSEYEEGIMFDADDPDFIRTANTGQNDCHCKPLKHSRSFEIRVRERSKSGTSLSSNHSSDNLASWEDLYSHNVNEPVLTIEGLRQQLYTCVTCGVCWHDEHMSLDCKECGGYTLSRPCPLCDGECESVWKRDLSKSHTLGRAYWSGECGLSGGTALTENTELSPVTEGIEKIQLGL